MNRRLVPYLLLVILTLGAGLGVGLGLAQGPNTYSAPTTLAAAFKDCGVTNVHGTVELDGTPLIRSSIRKALARLDECLRADGYGGRTFGWVAYAPGGRGTVAYGDSSRRQLPQSRQPLGMARTPPHATSARLTGRIAGRAIRRCPGSEGTCAP